ncbi:MAG: recombinase family protein [Polyangiaceae bacterium]
MSGSKKCAIYFRVSKTDGSQSVDNQRPEVEQLARARGLEVVHLYEEQASAAKHRPEHERMMRDARRGAFAVLVIWALDRFGRSMIGNMQDVTELDRIGVTVVSVRETWLDTGGPVRALLIAIFSWCAEQERARLIERTKAGLAIARRKGRRLGRPRAERRHADQKGVRLDVDAALALLATGVSRREVARRLKVPEATLRRALVRANPHERGAGKGLL